jgi:hypothetical protein
MQVGWCYKWMFATPSIWCHSQPFFKSYCFVRFFGSFFPICLIILYTPISTVFFSGFSTWRSHNHYIRVRYTTRGPIGRSVVCFSSLSCFLPYNSNPPYLCFPFLRKWYTYNRSYIKCGPCVFIIVARIIIIMAFNATNKVCSLVSTKVVPCYIISS